MSQIEVIDAYNTALIALGYEPRGENGIPGRRYFVKGTADVHSHHLHVFQIGHQANRPSPGFQRLSRAHPDQAQTYSQLKETLAQEISK